jgi:hypothetical protein
MLEGTLGWDLQDSPKRTRLELHREQNLDLVGGTLVDPLSNGEGLVSNHQKQCLQQTPMLLKISADFDQSALSHSLVLRNTVLGKSMREGADYEK